MSRVWSEIRLYSAVLAAALERSRARWLHDSIFEKYWVKPSKKRGQVRPIQNPPRESMTKHGSCTIVIEPHYFEAVLYTVRSQSQSSFQYSMQYPSPNSFQQYHSSPSASQSQRPYQQNIAPPPPLTSSTQQAQSVPSFGPSVQQPVPPPSYTSLTPQALHTPPTYNSQHSIPSTVTATATGSQSQQLRPVAASHPVTTPAPLPPPPKTTQDPVIQMLATRAASNPDLKSLMQVVASKMATPEQLLTFQAHIDELNAIIAARNQREAQAPSQPFPPAQAAPSSQSYHTRPPVKPQPNTKPLQQHYNKFQPNIYYPQHPSSFPPPKPDIKAVVFEFITPPAAHSSHHFTHTATGDRFLFPPDTILDYFPGGTTVIASFLVIKAVDSSAPFADLASVKPPGRGKYNKKKKGADQKMDMPDDKNKPTPVDEASSNQKNAANDKLQTKNPTLSVPDYPASAETPTSNPDAQKSANDAKKTGKNESEKSTIKEYYQPVTMRLHASNPRILEPLARIVKPAAEVRRYMNDIMDRLPRADITYLAFRLPREGSVAAKTTTTPGQTNPLTLYEINSANTTKKGSESTDVKRRGRRPKTRMSIEGEGENCISSEILEAGNLVESTMVEDEDDELNDYYDISSSMMPSR